MTRSYIRVANYIPLQHVSVTSPTPPDDSQPDRSSSDVDELARLFELIAEAPDSQQDAMLVELCPDSSMRRQLQRMLKADSNDDPLLDHSLFSKATDVPTSDSIVGYRLLHELGQGGMGVVYQAEQLEPVRRDVALKVIKPGVDSRDVIARFDAERQSLSLMNHPNIAKVFDAGTTEKGRPYFVMELVKGEAITTYCELHQLNTRERLELFVNVCHATQHAHQKGIVHRDIKPSNVLVTNYDGRAIAKVIDFGVAKAIDQPANEATAITRLGQIVGTFEYMSPEQSQVNQVDVDTRSDIYALGVLLYELLTGSPPFGRERLRTVAWDEMLRIIREEDPPRPSIQLARQIGGDLDWIVMKAMEKDRNRRYATSSELATDITCFLNGDVVSACPPSPMYRFSKFARRNKTVFATTAIVAVSLVLGMIGTTQQTIRARKAEKVAEANAAEYKEVSDFLMDNFLNLTGANAGDSAGGVGADPNLQLLILLKNATVEVDKRFDNRPDVRADLKAALANSFNSIGRYDDASRLYSEYLDFLLQEQTADASDTLVVMQKLVQVHIQESQFAKAEELCNRAIQLSRRGPETNQKRTASLINDLGGLYHRQGRNELAVKTLQECLSMQAVDAPEALATKSDLAAVLQTLDRFDDAEKLYRDVLLAQRETLAADDARLAKTKARLGKCILRRAIHRGSNSSKGGTHRDRLPAAIELLAEGWRICREKIGHNDPETLGIQVTLSQAYCELSRREA